MNHGNWRARRDLCDAADISGCDHFGHYFIDIIDFAITQVIRQLGLQYIVRSGRPAT
jgi:hypothetical protein